MCQELNIHMWNPVTVFRKKLPVPKHTFELQIMIYAYVETAYAWQATFYKKQEKPCFQISIYSFKLAMYSHHLYVNHFNESLNLYKLLLRLKVVYPFLNN